MTKPMNIHNFWKLQCWIQGKNEKKKIELSNISNDTQKHLLWKLLIDWHCDGYTNAPVSDYINNPVFHELLPENKYMPNTSDERIYTDLSDSLCYKNDIERSSRSDSKSLN